MQRFGYRQSNNSSYITASKSFLASEFEIKDLGKLRYFLGIEVANSKGKIFICQRKYILDLIKETGKLGCRPANSPITPNCHLSINVGKPIRDVNQYQRLVVKLLYLSISWPDIAVGDSQFMHAPKIPHLQTVERILRYLKTHPGKCLIFKKYSHLHVVFFTYLDWVGSYYCYYSFVGGNLVTWRSKKQSVCVKSSTEVEYRALAQGVAEGIWLRRLLLNLKLLPELPIRLYCHNKAAIINARDPVKHFEIYRFFYSGEVVRDPRFESLCGELDPEGFRKRYNFLYDVELPAEKEKLQQLIKKSEDKNVIEELNNHISWIDKQTKSAPRRTVESEIISEHTKKEREAAKKGKRPYYLKKSEIRERKLIKKYGELKDQGKLESFIEKRRRKNASKDHRFMPYRKNSEGAQD